MRPFTSDAQAPVAMPIWISVGLLGEPEHPRRRPRRFRSIGSITNGGTYSIYVAAAVSSNVETIQKYLTNLANRSNNSEHNRALIEAVTADNLEITALILQYANLPATAKPIDPFTIPVAPGAAPQDAMKRIIDNALRHASSKLIALLLKQPQVCEYLQSIARDAYTFKLPLDTYLHGDRAARTKCEFVWLAAQGKVANLPTTLKKPSVLRTEFDAQRKTLLWGFKQLTAALNEGLIVEIRQINDSHKRLPGLPMTVINKIYDLAIGDDDLQNHPFAKEQVLALAVSKPTAKV